MTNYDQQDFDNADKLIRSRQFFTRAPKKSADIVAQLLARKGYGQQSAVAELQRIWQNIAADEWRNQTQVGIIRRGVLEIIVGNSMLNQRLEFEKKRLLAELKKHLPQSNLRDIRFRIGNLETNG